MNLLTIFTLVVVLSALFAYINERFLKLPSTIGLMMLALGLSIALQIVGVYSSGTLNAARSLVGSIDFSETLLDFMLSFLLFAGALHTDWSRLHSSRAPILTFATLGLVLSALAVGTLLYYVVGLFNMPITYLEALLFGALISPTDPIAVLGILKKAGVPESTETKIIGESLFNDGIGVVTFIALMRVIQLGVDQVSFADVGILLLEEVAGGITLGLVVGFAGYRLLKSIDHYQTEVLITIAMVMGGYLLASVVHFSGPLVMVVAGIFIGNKGKETAMSDTTLDYTFKFWEMVDEILNAALFVLIGLELLVVPFNWSFVVIGVITIFIVLVSRFGVLNLTATLFGFKREFESKTISIMTWGGLRGGISIALALTVPVDSNRNLFLSITYVVVLFSIIVQGLTLGPLIRRLLRNGQKNEHRHST